MSTKNFYGFKAMLGDVELTFKMLLLDEVVKFDVNDILLVYKDEGTGVILQEKLTPGNEYNTFEHRKETAARFSYSLQNKVGKDVNYFVVTSVIGNVFAEDENKVVYSISINETTKAIEIIALDLSNKENGTIN